MKAVRQSTLIKIAVGLVAVALFGFLFIRSARNVGAQPYTLRRASLTGWTVALDPAPGTSGVRLALWPPTTFAAPLFSQLFTRSGLSLSGPNPVSMPLVLEAEIIRAGTGAVAPEALVQLARESGLEAVQPTPRCMASRRVSEPGITREVYFLRFDDPAFVAFRRDLAVRLSAAGAVGGFEPAAVSPVMIIAATDGDFGSWLPLQGDAVADCLAPLDLQ